MQPGESVELQTPLPRIVFLIGWALYLPFFILAAQWGSPTPNTYPGLAALGLMAGMAVFVVFAVRRFYFQRKKIVVRNPYDLPPPRSLEEIKEALAPAAEPDPRVTVEVQKRVAALRSLPPRVATLTQKDLQKRRKASPRGPTVPSPRGPATPRNAVAKVVVSTRVLPPRRAVIVSPNPEREEEEVMTLPRSFCADEPCGPVVSLLSLINMLVTEGPFFAGLVAIVFVAACVPAVGAYQLRGRSRVDWAVQGGFWGAAVFIFIGQMAFATAYAFMREAGERMTEDDQARNARKVRLSLRSVRFL